MWMNHSCHVEKLISCYTKLMACWMCFQFYSYVLLGCLLQCVICFLRVCDGCNWKIIIRAIEMVRAKWKVPSFHADQWEIKEVSNEMGLRNWSEFEWVDFLRHSFFNWPHWWPHLLHQLLILCGFFCRHTCISNRLIQVSEVYLNLAILSSC